MTPVYAILLGLAALIITIKALGSVYDRCHRQSRFFDTGAVGQDGEEL